MSFSALEFSPPIAYANPSTKQTLLRRSRPSYIIGKDSHYCVTTSIYSTKGENPEENPPPKTITLFFTGQKHAQLDSGNLSLTFNSSQDASFKEYRSIESNLY